MYISQLATLRKQNAAGAHSATSAIELVREFLDQAQLVADEGNIRNNRYKALLLVAAQVSFSLSFSRSRHLPCQCIYTKPKMRFTMKCCINSVAFVVVLYLR